MESVIFIFFKSSSPSFESLFTLVVIRGFGKLNFSLVEDKDGESGSSWKQGLEVLRKWMKDLAKFSSRGLVGVVGWILLMGNLLLSHLLLIWIQVLLVLISYKLKKITKAWNFGRFGSSEGSLKWWKSMDLVTCTFLGYLKLMPEIPH
ncbi:hypothetical protein CRYUN_Cryun05aG0173600 [Craigia yunnanensis]